MKKYMTPQCETIELKAESMLANSPGLTNKIGYGEYSNKRNGAWDSSNWDDLQVDED